MKKKVLLIFSVFFAGLCSIVYELLISTTVSYFLGDSIKQFSLTIGVYLFSMGVGAYFSKFVHKDILRFFIGVEYLLGLVGGLAVPILYFLFVTVDHTTLQFFSLGLVGIIGFLTGMEVPLLTFAFSQKDFKEGLSTILSLDYVGGLVATLIFPFILLPVLGLFYSSLVFGLINVVVGLVLAVSLSEIPGSYKYYGMGISVVLVILVLNTGWFLKVWDEKIFKDPITVNLQTPYQWIVFTQKGEDTRLFLNRVIQFSSLDEYRYHESLIHTPVSTQKAPKTVLVLGGGENLASRELLKHASIQQIDVVDIDSMMFHLSRHYKDLIRLNANAANHPKVHLIQQDAFAYLSQTDKTYDLIIADLPDPSNEALARLYSRQFFILIRNVLNKNGCFVTQAGEIYLSNTVYSCIFNTIKDVFPVVSTYHAYVPSFGDWGFVLGSNHAMHFDTHTLPANLKFLTDTQFQFSFNLPKDISIRKTHINTLNSPVILDYYLSDWEKWKTDITSTSYE